jgi:3-oxoacyl-[acyl-carrier-protein] synthase-1
MVTGVGLNGPSTCAAIRTGISGFVETHFKADGEWLIGCPVPLPDVSQGREQLLRMVAAAIRECLDGFEDARVRGAPVLVCLPELDRPGRLAGLDGDFVRELERRVNLTPQRDSTWFPYGRVAGVQALDHARTLILGGRPYCIVAGVDSLLVGATLEAYRESRLLQTATNSDGFIPGQAAAALLLVPSTKGTLVLEGVGYGIEPAPVGSGQPLRADGMVQAIRAALTQAGVSFGQVDYRIADISGAQYYFKEAALAVTRVLRQRKQDWEFWLPSDCVGEVGAAIGPLTTGVAFMAAAKGYSPGRRLLSHFAIDGPARAAAVLSAV